MHRDLAHLIARMQPVLTPGTYAFVVAEPAVAVDAAHIVASIREPEGLSLVLPSAVARELGLPVLFEAAWITLEVASDLSAIGFTAAFSAALGEAAIPCNVVAGARHDHLFVPVERSGQAMDVLHALQASVARV